MTVVLLLVAVIILEVAILYAVSQLRQGGWFMAVSLDALTAAVEAESTVEQSAITLIGGLAAQIQDLIAKSGNTVDPVALQALVDKMTASQTALAAAVTANTKAA
jgi:hypothetical protein